MDLKAYLDEVKKRCEKNGMHPDDVFIVNRFITECELSEIRKQKRRLIEVISKSMDTVLDFMKKVPVLVGITNEVPVILETWGNPDFVDCAKDVGIISGAIFQERYDGSNAPLAALELNKPVSLLGKDHYFMIQHELACYSVPITNVRQDVIATVFLLTLLKFAHPYILGMLSVAQKSIEREMEYLMVDIGTKSM